MHEFIKDMNEITPMPKGLGYDLEKGRIYRLKSEKMMFTKKNFLVEDGFINLPDKIYYSEKEKLLVQRILKYHKETNKNTTGVLFHGAQGCGKTLLAKVIANNSDLPVIIVDPSFNTSDLMDFFSKFTTEVIIIFDELDKHCGDKGRWDTTNLLEFLDGVQDTSKKLVIFTCNSDDVVNKFLKDRCSRIRYYKKFNVLEYDMIYNIVSDLYNKKDNVDNIVKFIVDFIEVPSYDNITSICKELNDWPDYEIEDLVEDLNLKLKE